jgi:RPA family protein
VNVSVRPESITTVGEATRDRWVVETAKRTIERIQNYQAAEGEDSAAVDEYVQMAREEYDLPVENYRRAATEALESLEESDDEQVEASP